MTETVRVQILFRPFIERADPAQITLDRRQRGGGYKPLGFPDRILAGVKSGRALTTFEITRSRNAPGVAYFCAIFIAA